MIHYTMNIRQTMLHLSGGLLLLLAPACTSEVDLEGGQPLEVTAEIVSSLSTRAVDATNYDKSSFSTDDEIQINGGSQTVTYRKDATNGWIPKTAGSSLTVSGSSTASSFSASYPAAFTFILQDQKSYENFWQSNKLEAKGGSNVTLSSNKVNFTFMPVAAKITISINYASSGGATTKNIPHMTYSNIFPIFLIDLNDFNDLLPVVEILVILAGLSFLTVTYTVSL